MDVSYNTDYWHPNDPGSYRLFESCTSTTSYHSDSTLVLGACNQRNGVRICHSCCLFYRQLSGQEGTRALRYHKFVIDSFGGTLHAAGLGADGIGPLATAAGGGQALMFFEGSDKWVSGIFIAASITFGIGLITQVIGAIQAGLLKGLTRILVFVAAIIFVGAEAIPSGWGLYGVAAAAMVVYIPIGIAVWQESIRE